jgi:DNA-binding transcriptional ArsR family regulator
VGAQTSPPFGSGANAAHLSATWSHNRTRSRPVKHAGSRVRTCTSELVNDPAGIADGLVEPTADVFGALSHALRLRIVERLATDGMATPGELAERFGESQQNVSKHLKTLAQAGLVSRRQDGSSALFSLCDEATVEIVIAAAGLARRTLVERSERAGLSGNMSDQIRRAG